MQEQSRAFPVDYLFEAADWAELPFVGLRNSDPGGGSPGSWEACGPRDPAGTGAERERRSGRSGQWRRHGGASTELRQM